MFTCPEHQLWDNMGHAPLYSRAVSFFMYEFLFSPLPAQNNQRCFLISVPIFVPSHLFALLVLLLVSPSFSGPDSAFPFSVVDIYFMLLFFVDLFLVFFLFFHSTMSSNTFSSQLLLFPSSSSASSSSMDTHSVTYSPIHSSGQS